ncbi:MAG: TfoX/Sxy family protein [Candidatus Woesearchaeota archaeon]|nr:TfoX/Sxy family protein [Candidatus Woesearchaeota archaeon]
MYDEQLAERIGKILKKKRVKIEEKKMFGGLCFMVDGKMCLGVNKDDILGRVGPDAYADCLKQKGCSKMLFTGREMKGFVHVKKDVLKTEKQLAHWVDVCLVFNPKAKKSKK